MEEIAPETPASQGVAAPETGTQTTATDEAPEDARPGAKQDDAEPKKEQKTDRRNTRAERRIGELSYRVKSQQQEIAELRAQIEAGMAKAEPAQRPLREKYDSDDDYNEAVIEWKITQKAAEARKQEATSRATMAEDASTRQAAEAWTAREEKFSQAVPDYMDAMEDFAAMLEESRDENSQKIVRAILAHERGPEIAYHLAKNEDAFEDLFSRVSSVASRRLNKIAEGLSSPAAKTRQQLPNPPRPEKAGGSSSKPLWELEGDAYIKARGL